MKMANDDSEHRNFRKLVRQALLMIVDAIERLDADEYRDRTAGLRKLVRSLREELRQMKGMGEENLEVEVQ